MRLRGFIVFLWVKLFNLSINHAYLSLVCLYISNSMKQEIYSLWISRSFQFKCLYRYARMYMCRYKCIFVVKIVVFSLHEDCKIRHAINKFIKQVLEQIECLLLATRHSWRHYLSANTRIMKSVVLLNVNIKLTDLIQRMFLMISMRFCHVSTFIVNWLIMQSTKNILDIW